MEEIRVKQMQRFSQNLTKIKDKLQESKRLIEVEKILEELHSKIDAFLRIQILIREDRTSFQTLGQSASQEEEINLDTLNLSEEYEIREIPLSALSDRAEAGANISFLRDISRHFEEFQAKKAEGYPMDKIMDLQLQLLWNIMKHVSLLIEKGQMRP